MPPLTRRWRATRPALAALVLVALATPMISDATPAAASPQDQLSQKQAQAAQLQAQIDANGTRISILDEQFNQTQLAIDDANQGIADTQSRLDAAATRADALKGELASRAAALYVGAANGVPADLVGASDVSELSSRTKYGSAAADEDHGLIDDVTVAKEQLAGAQAEFEKSRAAAEAKKAGLADTRNQLAAAQDKQQALLAQNKGEIATLAAQIEAQKRAADEAKARAEFQRKQAAAAKAPAAGGGSSRRSSGHTPSQVAHPAPPPSGGAATAVATAMAQIGKPYRYAAAGPDSFDCSGLTMFAWAAAGVRLPHSSAAQYAGLPHVAQSDLQPGDLVFYGSPIHHVGMYIGNGQYVHAPQTGDVVKVASAFRGDYVGGARP
jgi:cell wall-associated NlpC family hydrolase